MHGNDITWSEKVSRRQSLCLCFKPVSRHGFIYCEYSYRTTIENIQWCAEALVTPWTAGVFPDHSSANRFLVPDLGDLDESLVDEDDRDENGETLLSESGDVPDERAEVEGDDDE